MKKQPHEFWKTKSNVQQIQLNEEEEVKKNQNHGKK